MHKAVALMAIAALTAACSPTVETAPKAKSPSAALAQSPIAQSPIAAAGPTKDACALLTATEVEAATHVKVGAVLAAETSSSILGNCRFQHADTKAFGSSIVVRVALINPAKIADQKKVWTTYIKSSTIPGAGDVAYYNEMGGTLFAAKGDHAVEVQMLDGPAGAERIEALKTLANLALART